MKKLKKKQIHIQNTTPLRNEFCVACGYTKDEILVWAKKEKVKKDFISFVESDVDISELHEGRNTGMLWYNDKHQRMLLVLGTVEDTWEFWETLLHELVHVIQRLRKWNMFDGEAEFEAYMTEQLFHSIRRKLQGLDT